MNKLFRNARKHPMISIGAVWMGEMAKTVADLFYPPAPSCLFCGKSSPELLNFIICPRCLGQIAIIEKPICFRCGRPVRVHGREPCPECRGVERYYQRSRSVGLYRDYFRNIILALKYHGRPELAGPLGRMLAARLAGEPALGKAGGIIPVPLHPERLQRRGYNQAELVAVSASKVCRVPVIAHAVVRERRTEVQSRLNRDERHSNVAGAFRVTQPGLVRGKRILLVDDILTTGSTASECAKVLLAAGATRVNVLTLAVGLIEEQWLDTEES